MDRPHCSPFLPLRTLSPCFHHVVSKARGNKGGRRKLMTPEESRDAQRWPTVWLACNLPWELAKRNNVTFRSHDAKFFIVLPAFPFVLGSPPPSLNDVPQWPIYAAVPLKRLAKLAVYLLESSLAHAAWMSIVFLRAVIQCSAIVDS